MDSSWKEHIKLYQFAREHTGRGHLQVYVVNSQNNYPVENAKIKITHTGVPGGVVEEVFTDSSGKTPLVELKTPPLEYSLEPKEEQPYSEYTIQIEVEGFEPKEIAGIEVLPGEISSQKAEVNPKLPGETYNRIVIPPHTLFYEYPPKMPEADVKPMDNDGKTRVLSRVVIPEYIIVHDGPLGDSAAKDYYVRYRDYIKNVACSEIYATWPANTIRANVLAIMSFTLNRVYTEYYRNKGYDFTITSSTAYDHKWIYGRNIFESISCIVDELFENYLSRPGVKQPILTQYCDGRVVKCRDRGWMTQWGSKSLGDQGYSAIEILRSFYGNDMYINVADEINGIPSSWPGHDLTIGSSGRKVHQIQEQLNAIAKAYPAVPKIGVDGKFGRETAKAVKIFQNIFGLPSNGIVDYPTWYKIQEIYVGVSRIAEGR